MNAGANDIPGSDAGRGQRVPLRDRPLGMFMGYMFLFLTGTGLVLSLFLWWATTFLSRVPGCQPGTVFDCAHVLSSQWSHWMGVPVSLLGAAVYLVMFIAVLWLPSPDGWERWLAWRVLMFVSLVAVSSGAWFTYLQASRHGAYCPYCMAIHVCSLILFLLLLFRAPITQWSSLVVTAAAFLATGALIGGQLVFVPKEPSREDFMPGIITDTGPGIDRALTINKGDFVLQLNEGWLVMGSPDAKHLIVELYDYTCPSCRLTYAQLMEARSRYGDQLAVVAVVTPLSAKCNPSIDINDRRFLGSCELARLSLAVASVDRAVWLKFHHWLFESERPRDPAEAEAKAVEWIGRGNLDLAMRNRWVDEQLARHMKLFALVGMDGLPVILWGPKVQRDLYEKLEFDLGVMPNPSHRGPRVIRPQDHGAGATNISSSGHQAQPTTNEEEK